MHDAFACSACEKFTMREKRLQYMYGGVDRSYQTIETPHIPSSYTHIPSSTHKYYSFDGLVWHHMYLHLPCQAFKKHTSINFLYSPENDKVDDRCSWVYIKCI